MDVQRRHAIARLIADEYEEFEDFADDAMAFLGFGMTYIQRDIAQFMQHGARLRMVMAQRGEAKSTLAAIYAVWRIIQHPPTIVLIVSGGEKQASEVATLVIRMITTWEMLDYLRPDKAAGDRSSVEAFDVHWALKGINKSPSVACVGITANLPGKRADLLIPDDVETNKNGLTVTQRELLRHLTKEFSSICISGDILYLGTPQSKDSIYNTLPARGYEVRIWPGRYPSLEQQEKYGDRLAPIVLEALSNDSSLRTGHGLDGKSGAAVDPARYDDAALIEKELDKGPEDFALQYMLDTSLSDALRQQLKLEDLVVANWGFDRIPEVVSYQATPSNLYDKGDDFPVVGARMYQAAPVFPGVAFVQPTDVAMFVDPAGGGGDEIGYGVSTAVGPYVHVPEVGGLKGGMTDENLEYLCEVVKKYNINRIRCESNMGHGAFEKLLLAALIKAGLGHVGVTGEYSVGQKERRIINRLVSAMQRHRVIVYPRVFEVQRELAVPYSAEKKAEVNVFHQLANITTDRDSLSKDDRLEAMAGAVSLWHKVLTLDEDKAAEQRKLAESRQFLENPMGYQGGAQKVQANTRGRTAARRARR